ncbi:MAG: response regulator transcription factor [Gammaproteobacteria bacterium]|nr:response regulator transcription factor [Gammaproteobacteria bacterium]
MRILLVDDHVLLRAGLRCLLQVMPKAEVVGEADQGPHAMEMASRCKPDLILLDLSPPEARSFETLADLRRRYPDVRILIVSAHEEGHNVRHALLSGANGYLVKNASPSELEFALQALARHHTFVSPRVSHGLVDRRDDARDSQDARLSQRQRQVLRLIARGRSTKEIAHDLGLSVKTVETHRARLMEVLEVRGTHGLLRYALQAGFDRMA